MKEAEGRLNIHENYLKILINKELDYFRKKIISEDNKIKKDQIIDAIITIVTPMTENHIVPFFSNIKAKVLPNFAEK